MMTRLMFFFIFLLILFQLTTGYQVRCTVLKHSKLWGRKFTSSTYGTFADVETRRDREVKKFQEKLGINKDMLKLDTIKNDKTGRELKQEAHKNRRNAVPPPKVKLPPIESTFNTTRNLTQIAIIVECLNGCYNGMLKHWHKTTENSRMLYFEWEKFYNLIGDRIPNINEDRKRKKIYSWIKYCFNKKYIWINREGVWEWMYKPFRLSKTKTRKRQYALAIGKTRKRNIKGFL